jgi:hypothetical protein
MRNGQQKRMRGRNRNRGHNPLTRVYESNGPEVKVRGTAHHIAEKYVQLARDAQASGDPIAAEGYLQHAEHYFRLIAAAQAQFAQQNPHQQQQPYQRPDMDPRDEFEEGEGEGGDEASANPNAQPYAGGGPVPQPQYRPQPPQPQPQPNFQGYPQQPRGGEQHAGGLPAFITGGGAPGNGYDNEQGDRGGRFGRDRNRHRHFRHGGGHQGGHQGGQYEQRGQQHQGGQQQQGETPRQSAPQSEQNAAPTESTPTSPSESGE